MTTCTFRFVLAAWGLLALACGVGAQETLRLHPDNPRYFQWRNRPLVIIGSGEHYGAVLNGAFDFSKYLSTLGREGMNHTRLFTGATYIEPQGAFNIASNTLAPASVDYFAPWARSEEPGYAGGGNRFNLERWNDAYFERLRAFMQEASRKEVIVEVTLFCPFYSDAQWRLSPFHPDNHISAAGRDVARTHVYTLDHHGGLLSYQERFVRRVVAELRQFDNLYYEVCNEPYAGDLPQDWQTFIASIIADAQASHPDPKLISQNIANDRARVERRLPHIDIYNFHYAAPPDTVALNLHLERPIGDNETGFRGTNDAPYRMEAWDFIVAGGALFSHLDYSFTVGHEDGTFPYPSSQPGGGNASLRRSFRALRTFIESVPFLQMKPDNAVISGGVPDSHTARALVEPGRVVAAYLRPRVTSKDSVNPGNDGTRPVRLEFDLPEGTWRAEWIDPKTGSVLKDERVRKTAGLEFLTVESPSFREDIALRLTRR